MTGGGALDSSVTLEEVFAVVGAKRVPLAPELAGYLVLEIAEHANPSGGDVDPKSVFIGEEGTVALVKPKREAANGEAEISIRAMLSRLLDASGSLTPALAAASKRKSGGGLASLVEELETALIPVNRAAGRRALARLAREVRRVTLGVGRNASPSSSDATPSLRRVSSPAYASAEVLRSPTPFSREEEPTTARGQIPDALLKSATPGTAWSDMPTTEFDPSSRTPSPSQADVDDLIEHFAVSPLSERQHARELKALAGLEPTPPPPSSGSGVPTQRSGSSSADARAGATASAGSVERQLPTQPSQLARSRASIASVPQFRSSRNPVLFLVVAAGVVALGAAAAWQLRSTPTQVAPAESSAPTAASQPTRASAAPCRGTLLVTDVPPHAEVLLHQGQAPVDVEKMPVGARLEFVATAEGYAPRRVVVPKGAAWDTGPDGKPRIELAVQLDKSSARPGAVDPWPAGEPGSEVGGQGPPGTVRVVSTPRGAEVWMLAGIGPEARIEQLRCDRSFDVLVAGPTTFRKRMQVASADFVSETNPTLGAALPAEGPSAGQATAPIRVAKISTK
jgi:hypothetical protein